MKAAMDIRILNEVIHDACSRLGQGLEQLDYPNGGIQAGIFHENNLIIHLAHEFLRRGFHCYGEAYIDGGRIDLLASDLGQAFVVEAKKFGDIGASEGIRADAGRIANYIPKLSKASDGIDRSWWADTRRRWAVIVIGCQRRDATLIHEAWLAENSGQALEVISKRSRGREARDAFERRNRSFSALVHFLQDRDAKRGVETICSGSPWKGAHDASLLWAAFPLA